MAQLCVATMQAALQMQSGDAHGAVESLEPARPYELTNLALLTPLWVRGQAYLALHQSANAVGEFQRMMDHPGVTRNHPMGAIAYAGLAEAYAQAGDKGRLQAAKGRFLELWRDGDAGIPLLVKVLALQ